MREHLRMDGVKVFDEDEKNLNVIMSDFKIKNKSEAWRKGLEQYVLHRPGSKVQQEMSEKLTTVENKVEALTSRIEDMYFVIRSLREELKAERMKP